MEIHRDIDIGPKVLPQILHGFHRALDFLVRFNVFVFSWNAIFEARYSLLEGGFAEFYKIFPATGVGVIVPTNTPRVEWSAQQLVNGHAQNFPANIP